jgi:phosphohistidine phosphatase SixA
LNYSLNQYKKTLKTILKILVFGLLVSFLASCVTSYYITRHAEREETCVDCPTCGLIPLGFKNAIALRDTLIKRSIDVIYTSNCKRTKETAAPLAKALGKQPIIYPADINAFIRELKGFQSNISILVVGHSYDIPTIVDSLAHVNVSEVNYGDLFKIKKITLLRTFTRFQKSHYGTH